MLHDIAVEVDDAAVAAMIDTYQETGDKDWIEATVTIDGATFEQVGLRLKGNSSLRGVADGADPVATCRGCCVSTSTSTGRR